MSKLKIAYLSTFEGEINPIVAALRELSQQEPELAELRFRDGRNVKDKASLEDMIRFASQAHILIMNLHGGQKSFEGFERLVDAVKSAGVPVHAQSSEGADIELISKSTVDDEAYRTISRYVHYGGKKNFKNLFLYLAGRYAGTGHVAAEAEKPPWEGIYHPDFDHVPSLEEYLAKKFVEGRPTIGFWFYHSLWQAGNTAYVDALIAEIERREANVIPVFLRPLRDLELGNKGAEWVVKNYFMRDGKPIIDVLISPLDTSLTMRPGEATDSTGAVTADKGTFLELLGVPVIKVLQTLQSFKEWSESIRGVPMEVGHMSVTQSEFDGMLITIPVASREWSEPDALTGTKISHYEPIPERIEKAVGLSLNWAKLRHTPNKEKKVAIIFHNYPPRDDRIGTAFGLDSPESALNILRAMKDAGYTVGELPDDGQALIKEMLDRATNDRRWRSPAELESRAIATIPSAVYEQWFAQLSPEAQEMMRKVWGAPPGELFAYNNKLIVPGIVYGNVFVGIQPPRGILENSASIYHSLDHPVPHHYYAYYRWIRDVFGACAVIHVGTHGTLEWLPGKSVGLSRSCQPDMVISDLPNIYPYIISNPGEGTQAKRRSYCCIIDHLVPVMNNADSYDQMAELDVLLHDYIQAAAEDPKKVPALQKQIWEKTCEAKLDHDLETDEAAVFADFEGFHQKLHDYLFEISDTQIRDGLHTLGVPPAESRLVEFLVALTRLNNGNVPSLRESLAEMLGFDYNTLLEGTGKTVDGHKTGCQVIEEVHGLSLRMVTRLYEEHFEKEAIPGILMETAGKRSEKVEEVMDYIATSLAPNLAATTNELGNVLAALAGRFVPPGPSGAPTRGMADILPTGRNFYSVDPRAIPSPAAWRVGISLGDALVERYLKDEGRYPETLGIVIWGTPIMRTKGDDIAEVLYLMGVRPVWESRSGRVTGLEIMSLEELGRPRIDVTLRISGFFRDSFPNLIHLIDRAVEMVASLKEPEEMNYLAKNVARDTAEKIAQGADPEQARNEALYRLFGCRPGTYGAGVSAAIDSKNWKDVKDLAEIYVTWGCFAYGRKTYGATVPEEFKRRLSRLDMAVKNQDTREYDMLDSDDFYSYHGGMITAVKVFKGEAPRAYIGDSADPDRIKARTPAEETKHIFRSRILNPKWIESMKRHGYKGAGDFSRMVDVVFGWDATAEVMEDWMYEALANKYALDKEMQDWLKEVNPSALQNITERLLEAIERGMWDATDEMKQELQDIYLDIEGMLEDNPHGKPQQQTPPSGSARSDRTRQMQRE